MGNKLPQQNVNSENKASLPISKGFQEGKTHVRSPNHHNASIDGDLQNT